MILYFSCSFPSIIKLGGIYYGRLDQTVKKITIEDEPPLIEICPLSPTVPQLTFFIDHDFLSSPPDGVFVTDLKGGYFINYIIPPIKKEFRLLEQKRFQECLVTIFNENGIKISIENENGLFVDHLSFSANNAFVDKLNTNGQTLVCVLLENPTTLLVYNVTGKTQKIFDRQVYSATFDGCVKTEERFLDIAKHSVLSEWTLEGTTLKETSRKVKEEKTIVPSQIPNEILPYAFLEELLVGGNFLQFLADDIKENADKLKSFFGDYIGVFPPPKFRRRDEIGLIYVDGRNLYKVEYFTFELKDGLILNIKKVD